MSCLARSGKLNTSRMAPLVCAVHHRIAFRFELVARLPIGKRGAVWDLVTYFEQELGILCRSGEIPVGFDLIGCLVVVVRSVFVALLFTVAGRLTDDVEPALNVERRQADF